MAVFGFLFIDVCSDAKAGTVAKSLLAIHSDAKAAVECVSTANESLGR